MMNRDPNPSPLLPPPVHLNKKLVVLLTNSPKLEKSQKPTGFDIRDLAHVCEILFYYFSRTPSKEFPQPHHPEEPRKPFEWTTEPIMDWKWVKQHFVIASLHGGEAPIDPMIIEDAKKDFVTKEFMRCTALMEMIRNTTKLTDVDPKDCYGVVVCGGHGCLQDLATSPELGKWLYTFYQSPTEMTTAHKGKNVLCTICHGTVALLTIGKEGEGLRDPISDSENRWIKDKKITCFSNEEERQLKTDKDSPFLLEDRFRKAGATIMNGTPFEVNVVQDDRLITAQNSESVRAATRAFIHAIFKEQGGHHHKPECTSCQL